MLYSSGRRLVARVACVNNYLENILDNSSYSSIC